MLRSELRSVVNISGVAAAALEGHSLSKELSLDWEDTDLFFSDNESIHVKRMKNIARWEGEGGGPLAELGYDDQIQKRVVQDLLNVRIARHLLHNPSLYGGVILLAGDKIDKATEPYTYMSAAKLICIAEDKPSKHSLLKKIIETFGSEFPNVRVYAEPLDIVKVSIRLNKKYPGYWKGFDLDFDTSLTDTRTFAIKSLIESINSETFWLRVTATQRPIGKEKTAEQLGKIVQFVIDGGYQIHDLACGDAFTYCDTASMSTMQVICKRR